GFSTASVPGTGSFVMDWIGAHILATNTLQSMIGGAADSPQSIEGTYHTSLFGGGIPGTTIPRATGLFPYASDESKFTNSLTDASHVPDGAATFTLLINSLPSILAVSSLAGQSGYWTDTTHTVAVAVGHTGAN